MLRDDRLRGSFSTAILRDARSYQLPHEGGWQGIVRLKANGAITSDCPEPPGDTPGQPSASDGDTLPSGGTGIQGNL